MGANDVLAKPQIVPNIAHSLLSPNMLSRRTAAEILSFIIHFDENAPNRNGLALVLTAFDQVEQKLNSQVDQLSMKVGRFDIWIKQLETMLDGRGLLGSSVGASREIRGLGDAEVVDTLVSRNRCALR